jgi:T5orf172 domain
MADGRLSPNPVFARETLMESAKVRPGQAAASIHVHPNGRGAVQRQREPEGVPQRRRRRRAESRGVPWTRFYALQCYAQFVPAVRGYLYILSNSMIPGLLKIGFTTRSVADRVSELGAATGVPVGFTVEAYFESTDPIAHEKSIHKRLAHCRMRGKEFFRVSVDEAVEALREVTGKFPLGNPRQLSDEERFLSGLRDHIIESGRPAPSICRCIACCYSFFAPADEWRCPRCGRQC